MPVKIKSVAESVEDNGLKAIVHAPAGTGKTVLGATAMAPTIIISAESGLLSLTQDKQELIAKGSPDFAPEFCDVAEVQSLAELGEVYDMLVEEKLDAQGEVISRKRRKDSKYEWIILDSGTEIAEQVLSFEMKGSDDPRKIYPAMVNKVLSIIKSFRDAKGYNVLMTTKQERVKEESTGRFLYGPDMPGNKLAGAIPYLVDEVWCLRIGVDEETKEPFHYLQCVRDNQYEAKDRSGKLGLVEPPSLARIHAKIYGTTTTNRKPEVIESVAVREKAEAEAPAEEVEEAATCDHGKEIQPDGSVDCPECEE